MIKPTKKLLTLLLVIVNLTSCHKDNIIQPLPEPIRPPITSDNHSDLINTTIDDTEQDNGLSERFISTPQLHVKPKVARLKVEKNQVLLQGEKSQVSIENLTISDFINEIFGNTLGLSFKLAPGLDKQKDLVTLRFTEPQSPESIYQAAIVVLADYGVKALKKDNILRFSYSKKAPIGEPPLFVTGRALPNVPVSHRPIFQLITLHSVSYRDVKGWLKKLYEKHDLTTYVDPSRNAIILHGSPEIVAQAVEATEVLDQPSMSGRHSVKITPLYQPATSLADSLIKVLQAEGYAASKQIGQGSVIVLAIEAANAVFVFSSTKSLLDHVEEWVKSIDRPTLSSNKKGLFYYKVQNVDATGIITSLATLTSNIVASVKNEQLELHAKQQQSSSTQLQIDEARNAIMFYGKAEEWTNLLPIIKKMDVPARQVLIEITVAEITLTDDEQFGIEWRLEESSGDLSHIIRTLGGLGVASSGGLSYIFTAADNVRAILNAQASKGNVNILSTPRVLVKSGAEATIEVGTEIPIITSQASAADLTNSGDKSSILQNIQYRKTGTLLTVKPIVYAGRRVDIDLTQEVSKAQENKTSGLDSPTILNRKVDTHLTLEDGHSILLAGLIDTLTSQNHTGIPYLMDIPYLGSLFSSQSESKTRTEIIILITPYVIDNSSEIAAITNSLIEKSAFKK